MNLVDLVDAQAFELAAPVWEKMKCGSNAVDYELFSSAFSSELKALVSKQRFQDQCKEFPLLTSLGESEPIACIRRKEGITVIFRQLSKELEGEFIGQLTLAGTEQVFQVINAQVY